MEIGRVDLRVFLEPEEHALTERFIERICGFARFDLASFRAEHPEEPIRTNRFSIAIAPAEGFDGTIRIIEASVEAKKDAGALFDRLVASISEDDRAFLASSVPSRVDDEAHCYVRVDKLAFLEGRFELVDHGKCVRFDFNVLTYPKSRDRAVRFVEDRIGTPSG